MVANLAFFNEKKKREKKRGKSAHGKQRRGIGRLFALHGPAL